MLTVHEGNMTIAINHIPEQSKQKVIAFYVHVFSLQLEGEMWHPIIMQTWKKWKKSVLMLSLGGL